MRARVKANSPLKTVRACAGRDFTRREWTELPDSFLKEIGSNQYLEVEQAVSIVEPDAPIEVVEPEPVELIEEPREEGHGVVLAGNAAVVKDFVSVSLDAAYLAELSQAELDGKARKSVLSAIAERIAEIGAEE